MPPDIFHQEIFVDLTEKRGERGKEEKENGEERRTFEREEVAN